MIDIDAIRKRWDGLVRGVVFAECFLSAEMVQQLSHDFRDLLDEVERLRRSVPPRCGHAFPISGCADCTPEEAAP